MDNIVLDLLENPKKKKDLIDFITNEFNYSINDAQNLINDLELDGLIFFDPRYKKYTLMPSNFFVVNIIEENDKLCFIHNGNKYYINSTNIKFNDTIIVKISNDSFTYIKHLKHNINYLTFEVSKSNDNFVLIPFNHDIKVPPLRTKDKAKVANGDLILVYRDGKNLSNSKLDRIIGNKRFINDQLQAIIASYGLMTGFSEKSFKEASNAPQYVESDEMFYRENLIDDNTFSIDPENAQDLDDAFSIDMDEDGYFIVKVHISDVTHYVPLDSSMFEDALKKSASKYVAGTVDPMFPDALSSGICSLTENKKRLVITVEMTFDENGNKVKSDAYLSVIRSKKQMNYKDVNKILINDIVPVGYSPFIKDLLIAQKLSLYISKRRLDNGALVFNETKSEFIIDDNGKLQEIKAYKRGPAETIIENIMIEANNSIAELLDNSLSIYRNHDYPNKLEIKKIIKNLFNLDINLNITNYEDTADLFRLILKHSLSEEEYNLVCSTIIKSQNPAYYSTENKHHFGLGLDHYTHFTSPIRRIIDFLIHYILKAIINKKYHLIDNEEFKSLLEFAASHATKNERIIDKLENDINQMMMPEYMADKIGKQYTVKIKDITPEYIVIYSPETLLGYIPIPKKMKYDNYDKTLKSLKSNKVFKIHHNLIVSVARVDLEKKVVYYNFEKNLTIAEKNIHKEELKRTRKQNKKAK